MHHISFRSLARDGEMDSAVPVTSFVPSLRAVFRNFVAGDFRVCSFHPTVKLG